MLNNLYENKIINEKDLRDIINFINGKIRKNLKADYELWKIDIIKGLNKMAKLNLYNIIHELHKDMIISDYTFQTLESKLDRLSVDEFVVELKDVLRKNF